MKSRFFHKITLLSAFIAVLMGCNSCNKAVRICQQEYDKLIIKEFHSLGDATTATSSFLSKYSDKEKCEGYCDTVRQIEADFTSMGNLFSAVDRCDPKQLYSEFMTMVNLNDQQFSGSSFATVQNTWKYLVKEKEATYLEKGFALCQQEYDQLSTKEFRSLEEAKTATGNFLNRYSDIMKCSDYCAEVKEIRTEFENMERLFFNVEDIDPEYRYCDFLDMVNSSASAFFNSSFETVRKTWTYLARERKDIYLKEMLDLIDEEVFMSKLRDYAESEVLAKYRRKKFSLVDSFVLNDMLEEFSVVEARGTLVKKGTCVVHVKIEGNRLIELSRRRGDVEIRVEGAVSISDSNCRPIFKKGRAEFVYEDVDTGPNIDVHIF